MITRNALSTFHQWLLSDPTDPVPTRTIILHGDPTLFSDRLIEDIAEYLNEFDDDAAGRWLAATSSLVLQVAENPDLRQLLGMADACPNCPPTGPCGIGKTLTALGRQGSVIFRSVSAPDKDLKLPDAFHAGIGNSPGTAGQCHLVLNPELMNPASIAHIIGDVFLEWLHRDDHRATSARETA